MEDCKSKREIVGAVFNAFLSKHHVQVGTISENSVSLDQIITSSSHLPQLTKFRALDDTLLYSNLLVKLFNIVPHSRITTLIDFGAGSSIPTIKALLSSNEHSDVKVVAVDNDPEAIMVSKKNTNEFALSHRYSYSVEDMFSFLSGWDIRPEHVISSNPPYAPVPGGLNDPFFHPANGGLDGTKYIEPLLLHPMPAGTIVVLRWCSLDNPLKIIPIIEHNYDVLHIEAHSSPFGSYTGSEPLRNHLEELRKSGISYFTTNKNGQREFISVGCILKRR